MIQITGLRCLLLVFSLQKGTGADIEVLSSPREHIAGFTYESLQEVFQSYPVDRRNTDQTKKLFRTCNDLSGHRETLHRSSLSADEDDASSVVSEPCYSFLQNCRFDESMKSYVRFCVSPRLNRRYDYMEIEKDENHTYGRKINEKCLASHFEIYFSAGMWYPCVCDCESSERQVGRYFSLKDVTSDDYKVVTGVRFRKVDHVFYIQIQQGRLGPNRTIDGDARWKKIHSILKSDLLSSYVSEYYKQEDNNESLLEFYKNDFVYAVASGQNTVLLDNLEAGPNEVLTGLRFRQDGHDLGLEIQVTPFHEETGSLQRNASRWLHDDIDKSERQEVKLQTPNVPGRHESMDIASFGPKFIKFQVSDFKTDLGQTTVPFIDITDVDFGRPRPISGAGIFHRGSSRSAGFIALKAIL